ncbi:MAG: metal-dependent hydrolase [Candidatus Brocadiae bacterium]|nr:metal-dependent hydrolase [Candidatus Brocadiia bacterium]
MKGLTHFISGLAAATFFPQAVQMAHTESSFILVLGGIFGILPDTIDFKFAQFFEKYHYRVDPDPNKPDTQAIANTLAQAINDTHTSGKPKSILFNTIKKGADLWRQYRLYFDIENSKVRVTMGPLVNTSKKVYPGTEIEGVKVAEASLNCKLCPQVYDKETYVDIMSGPSFCFIPQKDGSVKMDFLSWHRRWSHSLTAGLFLGILGWLFLGLWLGFGKALIYGIVITAGFWVHVLEDQLGYMGSNLFWPFTKEKTVGTKSMHSGDAMPNFCTVWLALILIFYNLSQYGDNSLQGMPFLVYFAYTFIVPLFVLNVIDKILSQWEAGTKEEKPALATVSVLSNEAPTKTASLHQLETIKEVEDNFG